MMRRWWVVLLLLLAPLAQAAAVHAFLDRSHVSLGDTVTLNIQSSGSLGTPDLSPLQQDFQVLGSSRSSSVSIVNGKTTSTNQLGIALKPLHAGTLTIPALDVGGAKTQPLTLQVGSAPSGGTGKTGDPVFMQSSVLSSSPYVGQQTVYTVRLFYMPGVDGALSDPTANGARLIQLDRDHRYTVERDGYAYKVIERSWALIPQRSGTITVQGPVFQGQKMGLGSPTLQMIDPNTLLNNPNALLNGQLPGFGQPVRATAPSVRLDARAAPANAGKPWLPARNVQLKLTGLPANGQVNAGTPLTVTLSISASGQPADALPEPELPSIAGARVYPDRTQDATDDSGEWLQGSRTRSFAIVPDRNGTLTIPAITLDWWDAANNRAEQAALPAHVLQVSGVAASIASATTPPAAAVASGNAPAVSPSPVATDAAKKPVVTAAAPAFWRGVALASLALWLLAIVLACAWWWRRRGSSARKQAGGTDADMDAAWMDRSAARAPSRPQPPAAKPDPRALQRRALDAARDGNVAACEHALLAWARIERPQVTSAGDLRGLLSDPAQREALDALQRARWQGGDAAPACASVARVFARGFAWRDDQGSARLREPDLPPLYPS
ncbi:MAG: protein BatD [Rhodanobacteraceae bacterium]|nr:MAG: protein BatD [Rhodanobacteraceae bacterium]